MAHGMDQSISQFIREKNIGKLLFTPGPASLSPHNILGLEPSFSRGDERYIFNESKVLNWIKTIAGQTQIVALQGSATLAIEIALQNFMYGRVLVIKTGIYSDRLFQILNFISIQNSNEISIEYCDWNALKTSGSNFDWVVAVPVETSVGFYRPISELKVLAESVGAKLFLDATASIGLEPDHGLAEVCCFSSCKGLFGFTGGAFITFSVEQVRVPKSFYLDLQTHIDKRVTGPYSSILSLLNVVERHHEMVHSVLVNKKAYLEYAKPWLVYGDTNEPKICTRTSVKVFTNDARAVLYKSRAAIEGSVLCHLGEIHLGLESHAEILSVIKFNQGNQ